MRRASEGRPRVSVIRTGTANLASVLAGLRRVGAEPELTSDPTRVLDDDHVVHTNGLGQRNLEARQQRRDAAM